MTPIPINRLRDHPVLRALLRRCWPKRQHASEGAAAASVRSLLRRGLAKDAARVHTYRCTWCGAWHTGHSADREAR